MDGYDAPGVYYIITGDAIFSSDKPDKTAAAEIVKTPKEVLPSMLTPSAVVQRPEFQKESTRTIEATHQEMSVAGAVERVTLPPNLTETQG